MRDLRFDTVHLAAYSVRPGTAAARREDDVPLPIKKERLNHLLAVQREIAAARNALYIGSSVEILVDGIAEDGRPYGRTRENKVAWLPPGAARPGELHTAQVVDASAWQLHVRAGRHGGVRTSSKIRAPHLAAAVPEAPRTTLDLRTAGDTPILREYRAVKAEHPDAIVLARLGDFFEMFGEDAQIAAPILGVQLDRSRLRRCRPLADVRRAASVDHAAHPQTPRRRAAGRDLGPGGGGRFRTPCPAHRDARAEPGHGGRGGVARPLGRLALRGAVPRRRWTASASRPSTPTRSIWSCSRSTGSRQRGRRRRARAARPERAARPGRHRASGRAGGARPGDAACCVALRHHARRGAPAPCLRERCRSTASG